MTTVALIEDDPETLLRLQQLIEAQAGLEVAFAATNVRDAVAAFDAAPPDALVTDLGLPDGHGTDIIRHVSAQGDTPCLVLSMFGDETSVVDAILAGAKGYLLKDELHKIADAVADLLQGISPLSPAIARYLLVQLQQQNQPAASVPEHRLLSPRESEVLEFIAQGYRSKEIADRLDISYHTVIHHIRSVYDKLEVSSRSQAIRKASELGELR